MAELLEAGEGALRLADAALRTNGGRSVLLRMPAPATAGDASEELGLATPQFQDVELAPVVFRKAGSTTTLLVSASAVKAAVGSLAFDAATVLFQDAVGVLIDGVLYAVESAIAEQAQGTPYCYVLTLRAPQQ
jgi:hypothetical protein